MNLVPAGYFSKTHGVKGQLILRPEVDFDDVALKAVFMDSATGKAPYFIKELREMGEAFMVTLEEVDSVEKARKLIGKQVYIDAALVFEEELTEDWVGYELIDKAKGSLGEIKEVSDNGSQILLVLNYQEKEVLLPYVEQFVERVDEKAKKMYYNAPEGLIDVYLVDTE